ncbi:MAG: MoxR family ATPase [Planctomycetota bacterium]
MTDATLTPEAAQADAEKFVERFAAIRDEVCRLIVGQPEVVEHVLMAMACQGHVLLEGVPGLGKTTLVTSMAKAVRVDYGRVQFTPDLLPADIVGSMILVERDGEKRLEFQRGPVFTNLLLADEINRATPKTQSALLETMQERSVTVAGTTTQLDRPFFVLATQNPIESDGTYPLPEAQLDRFMFKLRVPSPTEEQLATILDRTGGLAPPEIGPVATGDDLIEMSRIVRQVPIEDSVKRHITRFVHRTHPETDGAPANVRRFVRHGASPRAAQAMLAASRCRALLDGRYHVSRDDIDSVAAASLRHRMILSFEGEAEGIDPDALVHEIAGSLR